MFSTPNLGLIVWDRDLDDYDKTQLAGNWQAIDNHDHSPGSGKLINTASIAANAITSGLLAPNSVSEAHIQDNSVDTDDIQDAAITASKLAPASVGPGPIAPGAITRPLLDPTIMPLGSVWLWWRQPGSGSLPGGGWEVMDGRPWNTIPNSMGLTTGSIPDMRGAFAQGADPFGASGPGVGVTGGQTSVDITHTHGSPAHTHGIAGHSHVIATDGDHMHTWLGGLHMYTRENAFNIGLTIKDWDNVQRHNTYYSTYIKNTFVGWGGNDLVDAITDMDSTGAHNHTGSTANVPLTTYAAGDLPTGSAGGTVNLTPKNVGLLYIMLVR